MDERSKVLQWIQYEYTSDSESCMDLVNFTVMRPGHSHRVEPKRSCAQRDASWKGNGKRTIQQMIASSCSPPRVLDELGPLDAIGPFFFLLFSIFFSTMLQIRGPGPIQCLSGTKWNKPSTSFSMAELPSSWCSSWATALHRRESNAGSDALQTKNNGEFGSTIYAYAKLISRSQELETWNDLSLRCFKTFNTTASNASLAGHVCGLPVVNTC